jgi:hypothetical protein
MRRLHCWLAVAVLAVCGAPGAALANGAIAEFAAGGVVFKEAADIAIEREDLFLSPAEVRVHYVFRSTSGAARRATLGFPLPPVPISPDDVDYLGGPSPAEGAADPRNYMAFEVRSGDARIEPKLHEYAWLDGKEVSAALAAHGVPAFLGQDAQEVLGRLDAGTLDALVTQGLVQRDESAPEYVAPLWQYQAVYEWPQDFSADRTEVEIRYRPLTGSPGDFGDRFETGESADEYCVDDAMRTAIQSRKDKGQHYEPLTLGYVLTTAKNWSGPIGEFNLTVSKADDSGAAADILVAFCPLEAKKVSPTEFKWSARNFEPDRDLKVVYYYFYGD